MIPISIMRNLSEQCHLGRAALAGDAAWQIGGAGGDQVAVCLSNLKFEGFSIAEKDKYYVQRKARNDEANQTYLKMLDDETDGIYMQDIMRGGIRSDDPRIPRNLSE